MIALWLSSSSELLTQYTSHCTTRCKMNNMAKGSVRVQIVTLPEAWNALEHEAYLCIYKLKRVLGVPLSNM